MLTAPIPENEAQRLAALYRYNILDTPREEPFERVIRLVTRLFDAPLATLTLVDRDRQWFKSSCGVTACQTDRGISFCGHVVYHGTPLIVPDTHEDPRFCDNPLVVGEPHVRFYAGVPLTTYDGWHIGVLCVQDTAPRPHGISEAELLNLLDIAALAIDELELRKAQRQVDAEQEIARQVIERATVNTCLSTPGVRHYYQPAAQLSGDILLASRRREDAARLFLIGDFTGHGIGAAIGVPALAGAFYAAVERGVDSALLLGTLNEHLHRYLPRNMFLTATLIEVENSAQQRRISVWNAGMPPPLLIHNGQVVARFASTGLPLGILPESPDEAGGAVYFDPPPGARLYAYSDGVVETRLKSGEWLGIEGLEGLLSQASPEQSFQRLTATLAHARRLPQANSDDMTLLELDLDALC
ncbi:hypothetical protein CKO15_04825 [Halorhodospira abdelmalekii]|uniref:PP2C family protein-serine/threonine phosphatase n=1 Tax=Halorhodospira abdelmalekii TaxID=421629 RepID=UPI00190666E4|nr:GAF domain-containing SpoIIE family protein phosphatase [Halorhodospira abdelmalekii]MBK1734619.1 hypothetical protein [Halorhodospira abdelmalekii]